jgi:hypothetical protein
VSAGGTASVSAGGTASVSAGGNGQRIGWRNGQRVGWRNGQRIGWRNGQRVGWRNGQVAIRQANPNRKLNPAAAANTIAMGDEGIDWNDPMLGALRNIGRTDSCQHSDDDDNDDDVDDKIQGFLGPDVAAIRRANAPRGLAASMSSGDTRTGIDLNDEKELADLEDPRLMAHMGDRRAALRAAEAAKLPDPAKLNEEDIAARRGLSTLTVTLREHIMALRCAADNVALHSSNAAKVASGTRPHGYPEEAGTAGWVAHLAKAIAKTAAEIEDAVNSATEAERVLTVARRSSEAAAAGYRARAEHYSAN